MITYKDYEKIRNSKGLKDADIAKIAHIAPSTFTDWKQGKSTPKYEKMVKIADALGMGYYEFVGPVGRFSSLNPANNKVPALEGTRPKTERELFNEKLIRLYHNAKPEIQVAVMTLLENSQKEAEIPSLSSREA